MANEPKVKCPNCQADAEELAKGFFHCPSCGAIFGDAVEGKESGAPGEPAPKSGFDFQTFVSRLLRNPKPGLIIIVAVVVAGVIGIVSFIGSIGSEETESEATPEPRVGEERVEVNEPYTVVAPGGVILYTEPDTWSPQVTVVPEDEVVTVVEKRPYWWRVVRADTSSGWALYRFEDFKEIGPAGGTGETE
jgi:hypothetical protein